ncbi:MAG TPA: CAP domain-containing protein, partial [Candidatus Doudnabacteria bacterium]|nr:CAP domain-containing protein [Candidatus Doudnabacteria bacterium]
LAQEFLCLFNQYRAQAGLGPISFNYSLTQVALGHSNWMNQTGSFSHEGINGSRLNDRCTAAGTTCRAENLAHNLLDAQKLLNSWVANPSHNRNLLGPYSIAGFGQAGSYVTLLLN